MNIVVRCPNWIGDCIMCLPALRLLGIKYPGAVVLLAARSYVADVFAGLEGVAGIVRLPDRGGLADLLRSARALRRRRFDLGVLFTNSFHSALLFRTAGVKRLAGYRRDLRGFMLHHAWDFPVNGRHHVHFYADLVRRLPGEAGVEIDPPTPLLSGLLTVDDGERRRAAEILEMHGAGGSGPWIGISPFAAFGPAKEWPPGRFAALAGALVQQPGRVRVLLFGSAGERERAQAIAGAIPGVVNLAGRLSLRQTIAVMSLCAVFVSNDSGLMHVAAALARPTVALFGPTRPDKTAPLHHDVRILHKPADCAPCNRRTCPQDHRCLASITVEEVLEAVAELLEKGGAGNG